ncbi:MAG: AAA family ATPase [Alphaproteobacteria bacterium]|nr:AAA family ATPase [Alphaproteobacteria bacterium]
MATLHLVCGLPGAGKSTLAARLESEYSALRLTPDEWLSRLGSEDGRDPDARDRIEELQLEVALRTLGLGVDVVLDNGFWSRSERDAYRARAKTAGAETALYFLDVPKDELKRRLELRNRALPPHTFHVTGKDIDEWLRIFEAPTADEPGLVRIST